MAVVFEAEIYKTVLENLTIGVCVVDLTGKIQLWNDGAEMITGHLRQETIGRDCDTDYFVHRDDANSVLTGADSPLKRTMHEGQRQKLELFLVHKDGQCMPVRVQTVPIRDAHNAIVGAAECFDARPLTPEADVSSGTHVFRDSIDGLTGILDKASFETHLAATLEDFHKNRVPFGLLSLSIDQLDEVKKHQGVVAAQSILRATAQTLAKSIGPFDVVGRSAEEDVIFAIVTPCPVVYLEAVAIKFQRIASRASIPWWGGHLSITVSVGGAAGRESDTVEELMKRSHGALGLKNSGDKRVTIR